jgi:hypothetical protein
MNPYIPVIPVTLQLSQGTQAYTEKTTESSVVLDVFIPTMKGSQSLKLRTMTFKITPYFNIT